MDNEAEEIEDLSDSEDAASDNTAESKDVGAESKDVGSETEIVEKSSTKSDPPIIPEDTPSENQEIKINEADLEGLF